MDFDLRLKALEGLATSKSSQAMEALKQTLEKARASLRQETQYELLEQTLSILDVIGHLFSEDVVPEVISFINSLSNRPLTYSEDFDAFESFNSTYRNVSTLIFRAIDILLRLRYLSTPLIVETLLELSLYPDEKVRSRALDGIKSIATYDLSAFYGSDQQNGIGGSPQRILLNVFNGLNDTDLVAHQEAILNAMQSLLSPTIEGRRWNSSSLTISHGSIPTIGGVPEIRRDAIQLLKRLYPLVQNTSQKLATITALNIGSQPVIGRRSEDEASAMISENTTDILAFFESVIGTAGLQIIQKIESLTYWIFFHTNDERVRASALMIEKSIAANEEYQIYKTLVGFEGIFEDWEKLRKHDGYWEETDKFRRNRATEFAQSITPENYALWRDRILSYSKTESDDLATFPVFYHFLEVFATKQPTMALKLLSEDAERIAHVLIPLLRGLWVGPSRLALQLIMDKWINAGEHLYACTKLFLDCPTLDRELIGRILVRATDLKDRHTISMVMFVAVSNYHKDDRTLIDDLFIPALKALTDLKSAQWIFDIWFRREIGELISKLSDSDIDLVLCNLSALHRIDYQAEEILTVIAQKRPAKVLSFLCQRLNVEHTEEAERQNYEAIPFALHKLNKPLEHSPATAVQMVRSKYDGNYGFFIYGGARLLMMIFPHFSAEFEAELLRLVDEGSNESLEFVLAVLRNYEGQPFIHDVCKAVIRKLPIDSEWRTEVYAALQSTGVVTGEYGFAEAYERKKMEVQDWLVDSDEKIRAFATWYVEGLDQMIVADRQRADEQIVLRKHRYNE